MTGPLVTVCDSVRETFRRHKRAFMQTVCEEQCGDLLQPVVMSRRDDMKQMLLMPLRESTEPFICQRAALEQQQQQHFIPSPSIDITTSICGRFALVISSSSRLRMSPHTNDISVAQRLTCGKHVLPVFYPVVD